MMLLAYLYSVRGPHPSHPSSPPLSETSPLQPHYLQLALMSSFIVTQHVGGHDGQTFNDLEKLWKDGQHNHPVQYSQDALMPVL